MARESVECPRCGSQSDASVQTCATCGTDLEWARVQWSSVVSGPQETYAPIILHIDDEIGALTLIGFILERAGYRVAVARDAFIALELLKRFIPDLIITGVMMPGMTGIELIAQLKADPVLKEVPVIVLSARSNEETVGRAMDAGAILFLSKPISHHDLVEAVASILGDSGSRNAT
jgi:CheY-like chemotaxis protein